MEHIPSFFVRHYSLDSFFNEIIETHGHTHTKALVRKEYVSYEKSIQTNAYEDDELPYRFVDLILSTLISDVVHKFRQVIDAKMKYDTTPKGLDIVMIDWDKTVQTHVDDLFKVHITVKFRTGEFIAFSEKGMKGGDIF